MKIVVLAGGLSTERDVSLSSGSLIANALLENGHQVALVDAYLGLPGQPEAGGLFVEGQSGRRFSYQIPTEAPDLAALRRQSGNGDALLGQGVLSACRQADLVFLALHGSIGENGQLQALLELYGIPYTGTGMVGSALAMDKGLAKELLRFHGVPTPDWQVVELAGPLPQGLLERLPCPCAVKPLSGGSSVGVALVEDRAGLQAALEEASRYENRLLVEERIVGREFSVGVLDGAALPVIEIRPHQGFYDYANKYQPGRTEELCPAPLSPAQTQELQQLALRAHRALRLGFYARIDFLLSAAGGFTCIEANTLPGMTPASLLPQEAAAAGISYAALCEKLVQAALTRPGN